MERTEARSILRAVESLGGELNKIDGLIRDLPDGSERKALLQALGGVMGTLVTDIVHPIVRQYPELDPDKGLSGSGGASDRPP
jgi:hypothetical protein